MNTEPYARPSCPHCGARGSVHVPSAMWKVAVVPAWITMAVTIACMSLLGPMSITILPVFFFGGICLLAAVHDRAGALPECGSCGKIARPAV